MNYCPTGSRLLEKFRVTGTDFMFLVFFVGELSRDTRNLFCLLRHADRGIFVRAMTPTRVVTPEDRMSRFHEDNTTDNTTPYCPRV